MPRNRDGIGLIEVVLAALVLALAAASIMVLSSQESRSVTLSRERYLASVRLRELATCFGEKSRGWYETSALPASLAEWDSRASLYGDLLAEHPAFLVPGKTGRAALVGETLVAEYTRLGIVPALLYEPFTTAAGRKGGLLTMSVRFSEGPGQERELTAYRVVY